MAVDLTPRELQIAKLICDGLSNAEIATELELATESVKTYIGHIGQKLGVLRRGQMIPVCFALGLADGSQRKRLPKGLTPTEERYAKRAIEGLDYRDIAEGYSVKLGTVRNAMNRVLDKCGVWSRAELASRYVE